MRAPDDRKKVLKVGAPDATKRIAQEGEPMFCWRITKYDPRFRDQSGRYLRQEWTAYSDIGKEIEGRSLDRETYGKIEDAYTSTALRMMAEAGHRQLRICALEMPPGCSVAVADDQWLEGDALDEVCRRNLRAELWCKLEISSSFYVHFGYDYYMYVGSAVPTPLSVAYAASVGLFVEAMASPYLTW